MLASEEKWQEIVNFIPQVVGENQEVGFWLYKNGDVEPYFRESLISDIDVIES